MLRYAYIAYPVTGCNLSKKQIILRRIWWSLQMVHSRLIINRFFFLLLIIMGAKYLRCLKLSLQMDHNQLIVIVFFVLLITMEAKYLKGG